MLRSVRRSPTVGIETISKRRWIQPFPPVYFGEIRGKDDGELVCFLFLDQAREEWVTLQDPDGELEALFA